MESPARVRYESEIVEVEDKTTLILPDEVPSSPSTSGNIAIGITAVNTMGNESDITTASVYVDFTVPEAPKVLIEED